VYWSFEFDCFLALLLSYMYSSFDSVFSPGQDCLCQ